MNAAAPRRDGALGSVLVLAKQPVAGRVKTRLTPPFSPAEAALLAAAALGDTMDEAGRLPAGRRVLVLDGSPAALLRPGWQVQAQAGGGLDERLAAAFSAVATAGPAVLVGMDTPQLRAGQLAVFDPDTFDCCLGLADDGGYWAIGFADPRVAVDVIPGVPMSTDDTGAHQLDRLHRAGLRVQLLDPLTDVDDARSAQAVADAAPGTAFAACHRRLCERTSPSAAHAKPSPSVLAISR